MTIAEAKQQLREQGATHIDEFPELDAVRLVGWKRSEQDGWLLINTIEVQDNE